MRKHFDEELAILNNDLIHMGDLIEASIRMSVTALETRNIDMAKKVVEDDIEVNNMERVIEKRCLKLLLREQPFASDLRFISSALKMITDMERIGDNASDISEIAITMVANPLFKEPIIINKMARTTIDMVRMSIDAFVKKDLSAIPAIIEKDLSINQLFEEVKAELIEFLVEGSKDQGQIIDFLMIAKHLEKIGDHAKNIAEWVYFAIDGHHYKS